MPNGNRGKNNHRKSSNSRNRARRVPQSSAVLREISANTFGLARAIQPTITDVPVTHFNRGKAYSYTRSYVQGTITSSTTVDQAGAILFTLAGLPDSTEFTNLYDVYRIKAVTVCFAPLTNGPYLQPLTTVIDYDDAGAVASLAELDQYQTKELSMCGAQCTRTLKPKISIAAYSGAFTSYAQASGKWLDCASPTIQYYGLKWYLPAQSGGTASPVYSIRVTANVEFRDVR